MTTKELTEQGIEGFEKKAQYTENPVETPEGSIDGSFYTIYKGDFEAFLQTFATNLIEAAKEEDLDKAWLYVVEATRAESWSKEELKEALKPPTV